MTLAIVAIIYLIIGACIGAVAAGLTHNTSYDRHIIFLFFCVGWAPILLYLLFCALRNRMVG